MDNPVMANQTDAVSVARRTARVLTGRLDGDDTYRTVRLRGTTDWLLLATIAGGGRLRVTDHRDVRTGPGEITVVEPYVPHDYGTDPAAGRWALRWAHLEPRPDWLP